MDIIKMMTLTVFFNLYNNYLLTERPSIELTTILTHTSNWKKKTGVWDRYSVVYIGIF